jgi:energy-coupling factor transport system permease protein
MSGTMNTIMDAQRSRGLETEGNLITRAKSFLPLISPVVMSSLINTRERAIALEIRGFEAGQKKTYLREGKMKTSDRVLCLVMAVVIAGAIVVRIVL